MAFRQSELDRIVPVLDQYIALNRPPEEIRDQVDIAYRIHGQNVELVEIRRDINNERIETPVAKATYVRTDDNWRIFWMRANLKWYGYDPHPEAEDITEFLAVVAKDEFGCFRG